jgi:hypothetical protein
MTLDPVGRFLVQGFGIWVKRTNSVALATLLGILNSTLLVWQTAMNAPRFRGNAFRYHKTVLESLYLPKSLIADEDFKEAVDLLARRLLAEYSRGERSRLSLIPELEAEMDATVYSAFGLSAKEIRLIEDEVARFRPAVSSDAESDDASLFSASEEPALEYAL